MAARRAAAQLARARRQQRDELAGGAERVGHGVAVVQRDRGPEVAVDLGDEDRAARRAARVELREALDRSTSAGPASRIVTSVGAAPGQPLDGAAEPLQERVEVVVFMD